jgi:hypothetical protein
VDLITGTQIEPQPGGANTRPSHPPPGTAFAFALTLSSVSRRRAGNRARLPEGPATHLSRLLCAHRAIRCGATAPSAQRGSFLPPSHYHPGHRGVRRAALAAWATGAQPVLGVMCLCGLAPPWWPPLGALKPALPPPPPPTGPTCSTPYRKFCTERLRRSFRALALADLRSLEQREETKWGVCV